MFTMVVVPSIDVHLAASEERHHLVQHVATRLALYDGECGLHLPSEGHRAVSEDGTTETAFTVHETHQPTGGEESFLLIVRTGWIVTAHRRTLKSGCDIFERVPPDTRS